MMHKMRAELMLAAATVALLGACSLQDSPYAKQANAKSECVAAVSQRLKAPSTAKFSDVVFTPNASPSADYEVTGAVDSQNSFGAMLRNGFVCTFVDNPRDGKHLSSVTMR